MLIPPEVSAAAALRVALRDVADHELAEDLSKADEPRYDEVVGKLVTEVRDILFEVADENDIHFEFQEYQVYHLGGQGEVLGKRRRIAFLENDLLVTLDPTPLQCAMIGRTMHPCQRVAAAFTQTEGLYERGRMLSAGGKVPMLAAGQGNIRLALQRAFLLHLPVNDDQRAMTYQSAKSVIAGAFRYPHTRAIDVNVGHFTNIWNPEENGSAKP